MEKNFELDYELSQKILARSMEIDAKVCDIINRNICKTREEANKRLNKLVYDMAEESGKSVYDICFNTVPDYEYVNKLAPSEGAFPARYIGEMRVKLRPLEFDFTRNGSHWKKKYFRLKEKMQELINNKDD